MNTIEQAQELLRRVKMGDGETDQTRRDVRDMMKVITDEVKELGELLNELQRQFTGLTTIGDYMERQRAAYEASTGHKVTVRGAAAKGGK